MTLSFRVFGKPHPQGSMKGFLVAGHVRLTSDNANLKPWREAVKSAALEQKVARFETPLSVWIKFYVPRPASYPKRITYPWKKPDLDKLVRGVFDALTEASVWQDDSLVCGLSASKEFADDDEPMGCFIGISELR